MDRTREKIVDVDARFRLIHLVLRSIGYRLLDTDPVTKLDVFLRAFAVGTTLWFILPGIYATKKYIRDLKQLSEITSVVLSSSESFCFLVNLFYQEKIYRDLVLKIRKEFWKEPLSSKYWQVFRRFDRIATGITIYIVSVTSLALLVYYMNPLLIHKFNMYEDINSSWRTPYVAEYWYDQRVSPNYEITYFLQAVGSIFTLSGAVGLSSLYAAICMHLCAKFRILQLDFTGIDASTTDREFFAIISQHRSLIQFSEDVEKLHSPILLVHFVMSTLLICLNIVKVSCLTIAEGKLEFLLFSVYFSAVFIKMLILCWMAEEVFFESEGIGTAAYSSRWYEASTSIQKNLLLSLIRAQKPCILTAGKFFTLTLGCFGTICSTSLSYYTLLMSRA